MSKKQTRGQQQAPRQQGQQHRQGGQQRQQTPSRQQQQTTVQPVQQQTTAQPVQPVQQQTTVQPVQQKQQTPPPPKPWNQQEPAVLLWQPLKNFVVLILIIVALVILRLIGGAWPNLIASWNGKDIGTIQQELNAPEPIDTESLIKHQEEQETKRLGLELKYQREELKHEREMEALRIREEQMRLQQQRDQEQNSNGDFIKGQSPNRNNPQLEYFSGGKEVSAEELKKFGY